MAKAKAETSITSSTGNTDSSTSPASQNSSSNGSIKKIQGSSSTTETEQSVSPVDFPVDQACNKVPKVMFAEWLMLDQFRDQNSSANPAVDNKHNNFDNDNYYYYYYNSDFQEDLMMQEIFLHQELGNLGSEVVYNQGQSNIGENMFKMNPKFEEQLPENGFVELISGQFNLTSDDHIYLWNHFIDLGRITSNYT